MCKTEKFIAKRNRKAKVDSGEIGRSHREMGSSVFQGSFLTPKFIALFYFTLFSVFFLLVGSLFFSVFYLCQLEQISS